MIIMTIINVKCERLSSDSCQKGQKDSQPLRIVILIKNECNTFENLNRQSEYNYILNFGVN